MLFCFVYPFWFPVVNPCSHIWDAECRVSRNRWKQVAKHKENKIVRISSSTPFITPDCIDHFQWIRCHSRRKCSYRINVELKIAIICKVSSFNSYSTISHLQNIYSKMYNLIVYGLLCNALLSFFVCFFFFQGKFAF